MFDRVARRALFQTPTHGARPSSKQAFMYEDGLRKLAFHHIHVYHGRSDARPEATRGTRMDVATPRIGTPLANGIAARPRLLINCGWLCAARLTDHPRLADQQAWQARAQPAMPVRIPTKSVVAIRMWQSVAATPAWRVWLLHGAAPASHLRGMRRFRIASARYRAPHTVQYLVDSTRAPHGPLACSPSLSHPKATYQLLQARLTHQRRPVRSFARARQHQRLRSREPEAKLVSSLGGGTVNDFRPLSPHFAAARYHRGTHQRLCASLVL